MARTSLLALISSKEPSASILPWCITKTCSESSSTISDVSNDEEMKAVCYANSNQIKALQVNRTAGTQSLEVYWKFGKNNYKMPITMRTRAAGGWSGKALYMSSSGIKQQ